MSYPTTSWRPHQSDSYAYPPAQPASYAPYPPSSSVPPAAAAAPQNPHPMSQHPPPPQQHYHSQSASPPRSFGGFGSSRSGGREMGSAASLPPLEAPGSFPYSQRGPYPPSPVSPSYPGGMAGQMSSSSSYTTSGPSGSYYSSRPPPPPESYMFSSCPPNVSMHPPPAPPRTPPPSAGRKERVPSAQGSFAQYQPVAVSSKSRPPSGYGAPHSYAPRADEGNYQQQAQSEDISKFFQEMTEILRPEGLAAISASPSFRQQQQPFEPQPPPPPSRPSHSSSASNSRPTSSKSEAKYNVSGVLLTEEEYRALADSPSLARRKSSLRTFAPTQSLDDTFAYGVNPSSTYEASQSAYLDFPLDLQRPASAPPTPAFEPEAVFHFSAYGSSGNSPPRGSAPLNRRRGSSLDPSIPRSFGSSGLVGYAPPQEYSYAPPRARTPPQQQQRRPSASMQGWTYPETPMSAPQRGYYAQPPPPSAYTPYLRHQLDPISPSPAPSSSRSAPTPSTPSKPTGGSRRARGGNKSISFINFSAADSKTLLNGVAPSGSSKKRQRDEDDGRREAKRTDVGARE